MEQSKISALCADLPIECKWNADGRQFTTMRCGGTLACVLLPRTIEAFVTLMRRLSVVQEPFEILGNGSNTILSDEGCPFVVISTARLCGVERQGETLTALCGTPLPYLAAFARDHALDGMPFAAGIPGSVGGAVAMNAGAYGACIRDILTLCTVFDCKSGGVRTVCAPELGLSYRSSLLAEEKLVLLTATFTLFAGDSAKIAARMRELSQKRAQTQPLGIPSAGSTFLRLPDGTSAGKVLEEAGMKGYRIGDAAISTVHAGFIVNLGHASAREILQLIRLAAKAVEARCGILPQPEYRFLPDGKKAEDGTWSFCF